MFSSNEEILDGVDGAIYTCEASTVEIVKNGQQGALLDGDIFQL
jgi:hypothetical protein